VKSTEHQRLEGLHESLTQLAAGSAQRERLLAWIADAQQEERQRIAADIHDDTVQVMGAVSLRLELALGRTQDSEQRDLLAELRDAVDEASDRLRALLFQLIPQGLDRDLGGAISLHASHLAKEGGFTHELRDALERQPPRGHRETLFRMAHELLANVRKHAASSHVVTTVATRDQGYLLRVEDDGVGIAAERPDEGDPQHAGLRLVGDRVALTGGRWSIAAREQGGTVVEIWLPREDLT
jgi:signal transduction histidine kinase